ncbi:hypothetical protein D3C72_968880 [compost metagenome]
MARPFIEAAVLLAAHGHPAPPPRARRAPTRRKPDMPRFPYALLPRLDATTKPFGFHTLPELAAHIERERADQVLQIEDVDTLQFRDVPGLHDGVEIWTLDIDNSRDRLIGYAWLGGRGRDALQPALYAALRARAA